jgi:HAD superfamily phosphoserine phosphatase-like hydrolase
MENKTLAVFDFDHTLIKGDSLWPFLVYTAGGPRAAAALVEASGRAALARFSHNPSANDERTLMKELLLKKLLAGRSPDELRPAIARLRLWRRWNAPVRAALLDHHEKGHRLVIASGGLDLYLPPLLEELPPHTLICTRIGIAQGRITGTMPDGNCVRTRKAELLSAFLAAEGPFAASWGYGNLPHDLPMLNLLQHRIVIS